eukprot:TRINITY_DN9475_c0_g1_i1.p1 TRINITY_DN9475_c0_g1~~TRINITY_DN9475_c0_g1_i1.p1  ORF type:complete len:290 (+),score=56.62 TRINITY_DN9475_c0_g1_i1:107-976(+)
MQDFSSNSNETPKNRNETDFNTNNVKSDNDDNNSENNSNNNEKAVDSTRLAELFWDYLKTHFRFQGIDEEEARKTAADLRIVIAQEQPKVTYYAHRVIVFVLLSQEFIDQTQAEALSISNDLQQELSHWHPKDQKKLFSPENSSSTVSPPPLVLIRETSATTVTSFLEKIYGPESIRVFANRLQRYYNSLSIARFFDTSYITSDQKVVPTLKLLMLVCVKEEYYRKFGLNQPTNPTQYLVCHPSKLKGCTHQVMSHFLNSCLHFSCCKLRFIGQEDEEVMLKELINCLK